ncbi:MarR family transcriptional regulator [Herminiimonas sp. KBW02]|uniref:MarR family winged helix-turn-helix transcriptional regulator n=1 Tax=Herminiimonas sp. KBW02 TaxID=2153363 RepID=UPI000F591178|nr:MarR family transcriptional regulator [Herminiimonas sp. KBW02]RQO32861.1 MarR family transcriptional regulator [Herminiimonas sp. KBW02]
MRSNKAHKITELTLTVFRLNGALVDWGDDFSAPEELTSARWKMLGALALTTQALTAPQIATCMGVTRQGAQKQLNLLVESGLVEPRYNPQHKRSPLYSLTRQGRKIYSTINLRWTGHAAKLAAGFTAAELDTTTKVLQQLAAVYADLGRQHET